MVFISDGSTWIKNWLEDAFPEALWILDYYHVYEYLHQFAETIFKAKEQHTKWMDEQKELVLQSKVTKVISNIEKRRLWEQRSQFINELL